MFPCTSHPAYQIVYASEFLISQRERELVAQLENKDWFHPGAPHEAREALEIRNDDNLFVIVKTEPKKYGILYYELNDPNVIGKKFYVTKGCLASEIDTFNSFPEMLEALGLGSLRGVFYKEPGILALPEMTAKPPAGLVSARVVHAARIIHPKPPIQPPQNPKI